MTYLLWLIGIAALPIANAIPSYTEIKSSKAYFRRHGPFIVSKQNECAIACSCASGANQDYEDCTMFNTPIPRVECNAYSYDFNSRQCVILGGPSHNMCSKPVTIYEQRNSNTNPKCGSITLDYSVICDSEGYTQSASRIAFNGTNWLASIVSGALPYPGYMVQNITCKPAPSATYTACSFNGPTPGLVNALILKDTFGCAPGYKFGSVSTQKTVYTVPVCTVKGWLEKAGGEPITSPIFYVYCDKM